MKSKNVFSIVLIYILITFLSSCLSPIKTNVKVNIDQDYKYGRVVVHGKDLVRGYSGNFWLDQGLTDYKPFLSAKGNPDEFKTLDWINTKNDFNQDNLSSEQIDAGIKKIVLTNALDYLYKIEIPFNKKEFSYLGRMKPSELGLFDKNAKAGEELDKRTYYIYNYRGFTIFIEGNTRRDQFLVFSMMRMADILRFRYTDANSILIEYSKSLPIDWYNRIKLDNSKRKIPYLNAVGYNWILLLNNNVNSGGYASNLIVDRMEAGRYYSTLGTTVYAKNINCVDLFLDAVNKSDNSWYGMSDMDNFLVYTRGDVILTYFQEELLNFIDQYQSINLSDYLNAVFKNKKPFVTATAESYFIKNKGLLPSFSDLMIDNAFKKSIAELKNKKVYDTVVSELIKNFSISTKLGDESLFDMGLFEEKMSKDNPFFKSGFSK